MLDFRFGGSAFKSLSDPLAGFVLGSPEVKSSTMLVNSQLVCLWPVGNLSPVKFHLKY